MGYGTTSACAENTVPVLKKTRYLWNYLRVRGEYTSKHTIVVENV